MYVIVISLLKLLNIIDHEQLIHPTANRVVAESSISKFTLTKL